MSTLTKEWLQQTIAELEEERDAVPGAVNEDAAKALAAMKIALASLEAEPVPDERYQNLSELYHAQEKRLFKLAQRIKGQSFDKYSHSPSQAIDVLESAIFGEREDEACRAAMLQGADDNSPVIPDDLIRRIAFSLVYLAADEKLRSDEGSLFALVRQGIDVVRRELAAPQQEVKQALAKGMERYGDAMQELAKKEVKR